MFLFSDLPELVSDYHKGDVDWMITYSVLLRLLGDHEVEQIMNELSPELTSLFAESLRDEFGGDLSQPVIWIDTAVGVPPNRDQIIERIQRWLTKAP
jgi:hypothetical protein